MKLFKQIAIVSFLWLVGDFFHKFLYVPMPGAVLGMILLFILLSLKVIKEEQVKELSDFLLDNLAFFFIPASVGFIRTLHILKDTWWQILILVTIGTIVTMGVTSFTVQLFSKKKEQPYE